MERGGVLAYLIALPGSPIFNSGVSLSRPGCHSSSCPFSCPVSSRQLSSDGQAPGPELSILDKVGDLEVLLASCRAGRLLALTQERGLMALQGPNCWHSHVSSST